MTRAASFIKGPQARPRDPKRFRRDIGRFRFWQTEDGEWRGQLLDESAPSFAWTAPRGKYLGQDATWQPRIAKPKKPKKTKKPKKLKPPKPKRVKARKPKEPTPKPKKKRKRAPSFIKNDAARPRDPQRFRRDIGRFRFWQTKTGNWRGQILDGSSPSFPWKAPTTKYIGQNGRWRKPESLLAPSEVAKKAPELFVTHTDDAALEAFKDILDEHTPNTWSLKRLPPIAGHMGNPRIAPGRLERASLSLIQGFRAVGSYMSSWPLETTWHEIRVAVELARESPIMSKTFEGRRTVLHLAYLDFNPKTMREAVGGAKWTSPALSVNYNNTFAQAAGRINEMAGRYAFEDASGMKVSRVLQIRLLVE